MKKNHPTECKERPEGCLCPSHIWAGWYEICDKYVKDEYETDGRCKNCQHNEECHSI